MVILLEVHSVAFLLPYIFLNSQHLPCAYLDRYIEEHVQKTGVAIETQGFTFVTSGRKRESLTVSGVCSSGSAGLQL